MNIPDPQPKSQRCKEGERLFISFSHTDEWEVSKRYFDHIHQCSVCKNARINEHKEKQCSQQQS